MTQRFGLAPVRVIRHSSGRTECIACAFSARDGPDMTAAAVASRMNWDAESRLNDQGSARGRTRAPGAGSLTYRFRTRCTDGGGAAKNAAQVRAAHGRKSVQWQQLLRLAQHSHITTERARGDTGLRQG